MLGTFVMQSNSTRSTDTPFDATRQSALTEGERQSTRRPSSIPEELPISVQVSGTTFLGVYGVVGGTVELMSPDFGEAVAVIGAEIAETAAERLLRTLASHEMETTAIPFMRDHLSGAGF